MLRRSLTIVHVGGIPIRVHLSWVVIAALVVVSFWGRFGVVHDRGGAQAWPMAVVAAALFFGSILAHELAHALEARHRGVEVAGVTLFLFGGVTETRFSAPRPRDELAVTAIGPFTSLVLAAGAGLIAHGADEAGWAAVAEVAGLLGWLNLALGLFNLLPGAPLDGGRLLRSAVWSITGDRNRSARIAGTVGRLVGGAILVTGLVQMLVVPGAAVGGLWFVIIGWFLMQAAAGEIAHAGFQEALAEVPLRDVMVGPRHALAPTAVAIEAADALGRVPGDHVPVADQHTLVGAVGVDQLRRLATSQRERLPLREVMIPIDELARIDVERPATEAFDELLGGPPVLAVHAGDPGGEVLGIVTLAGLVAAARRAGHHDGDRAGDAGDQRPGVHA